MVETKNGKSFAILSLTLLAISMVALAIGNVPFLSGQLGISTASAWAVVDLLDKYQSVTFVISIIGAITGVGSISSALLASVLYILKKKGKAKAAAF
ncbi:circular bacteriocin, circularin A/uberolysin family [Aeribacillus pallidus]|uniref:uberolysin/carnocyclin family circular bacteriocin n=1 Tax=Aeribacillus pallidus TaxID=33936 RepID=UPI001023A3EA|nr:uberolysin/carnocyclin family circular bacteriocin [Aeribacillus pallidus]RZI52302.1 circular bacteriocin, circularin A/uberolysin family [Aeribacillus pallidus]